MQMMYEVVARELKSMQLENYHPWDYLNFYCLGNREFSSSTNKTGETVLIKATRFSSPESETIQSIARKLELRIWLLWS